MAHAIKVSSDIGPVEDISWLPVLSEAERSEVHAVYKTISVMGVDLQWRKMGYVEWTKKTSGASSTPGRTVIIVHGVTRLSRDYDRLAQYLAVKKNYRCLCVDILGRGKSDWAPPAEYAPYIYSIQIGFLIASLNLKEVDYIGTSLGGIIGFHLGQHGTSIRRMVIVDVGPLVPQAAQKAILTYLGVHQQFYDITAAEAFFEKLYSSEYAFGATKEDIKHIARHSTKWEMVRSTDGKEEKKLILHYDLRIRDNCLIAAEAGDADFWKLWDNLSERLEIQILRGSNSMLFTPAVVDEMKARGKGLVKDVVTIPKCGHAPSLNSIEQIELVANFLTK